MTVLAYTDGASRGNPGQSGIGIILKDEQGNILGSHFDFIGTTTNNVAEYKALIEGLRLNALPPVSPSGPTLTSSAATARSAMAAPS